MEKISTNKAPAAIGPYSQAIKTNGFIYTSGQIPIDPATGKLVEGNIKEAAKQAIENVKAILEEGGSSLGKVVKTICFLKDMGDFAAFNEVYASYFTSSPARSCVEVSALPKGANVEIEVIAEI